MTARDLRVLLGAAAACAAIQIASAYATSRSLETPNLSTAIAERLAHEGVYGATAWPFLRGPQGPAPDELLRAYQLPGEPLYLAAGFRWLPARSWRALHTPIVMLLVVAVGVVALTIAGRAFAVAAMALVALDPFTVWHGPVWDDAMLGAALEWTVVAAIVAAVASATPARRRALVAAMVAVAAAWAGVTRATSFFGLALFALAVIAWPRLRAARLPAGAALAGLAAGKVAWGVRNLMILGVFFTGATDTGLAIWRANAASARQSLWTTGVTEAVSPAEIAPLYARASSLGEVDADRMYRAATFARISSAPLDSATTAALKITASVSGIDLSEPLLGWRNVSRAGFNLGLLVIGIGAFGWRRSRLLRSSDAFAALAAAAVCLGAVTLGMLAVGTVGLRYRIDLAVIAALGAASLVIPRTAPPR